MKRSVMERYQAGLDAAMDGTVRASGRNSYVRNAAGRITTQLPHTSLWYRWRTRGFAASDSRRAR